MASANKTQYTGASVKDFVAAIPNERRRKDAQRLLQIFKEVTGLQPQMYGPTIIGFGNYHYRYESGREGDAPLAAFSPRKDSTVVYIESEFKGRQELLHKLGPHTTGKVCVYIKKLDDVDEDVIRKLVSASVKRTKEIHG